jgi:presenilin-like A22 family membrane protease
MKLVFKILAVGIQMVFGIFLGVLLVLAFLILLQGGDAQVLFRYQGF